MHDQRDVNGWNSVRIAFLQRCSQGTTLWVHTYIPTFILTISWPKKERSCNWKETKHLKSAVQLVFWTTLTKHNGSANRISRRQLRVSRSCEGDHHHGQWLTGYLQWWCLGRYMTHQIRLRRFRNGRKKVCNLPHVIFSREFPTADNVD